MPRNWREDTGPPGRFERVPLTDRERLLMRHCPRCWRWFPAGDYSDHSWYELP
jgi:hypothetical protein